jgi:hypothetical protein
MRMVLKHPPPSFFAPYPAARPRSNLLMTMYLEMDVSELAAAAAVRCVPLSRARVRPAAAPGARSTSFRARLT